MTLLLRQIWALTEKNHLILFSRQRVAFTYYRAFAIPVVFACYVAFILRVYFPQETYQIGDTVSVRSLADGMNAASGGRDILALVNSGFSHGDIDRVIQTLSDEVIAAGKTVRRLRQESDLLETCPSTLRGVTPCYGAAVFYSSPTEGPDRFWNYTIRSDAALGDNVDLGKSNNDVQIYTIPLQHAVDSAIASLNGGQGANSLPSTIDEYPFASKTQQQFRDSTRITLQNTIINAIACVLFLSLAGVIYQLVGLMAMERELGMSQLIESMMPNPRHWEPQVARLASYWLALSSVYFPGWLVIGLVLKLGLFTKTSAGIFVIFILLTGFAITSFSLLAGAFFKKAQLSGICAVLSGVGLAIVAQVVSKSTTATIAVLGLLFTPMTMVYFFIFMARYESQSIATNLLKSAPYSPWKLPGIVLWVFLLIQIIVYPVLAAMVERSLYDTASKGRTLSWQLGDASLPVQLKNVTKQYTPGWFVRNIAPLFGIRQEPVIAVKDLSMTAARGQVTVMVGANGSGKSTTLDLVAGLGGLTEGSVALDGTGGIGMCPQKNVLWDTLTVEQHVIVFDKIKSSAVHSKQDTHALIARCGMKSKTKSPIKTLSGGQKRKVQLMMMLTGGSRVCCVDEVSGGLDPLSRRKVWDILLAERGSRTILLTTHFLDEAELLADHIIVLSKGTLKAEGSSVELKNKFGGGYQVVVLHGQDEGPVPQTELEDIRKLSTPGETTYLVPNLPQLRELFQSLEQEHIANYSVHGPTIQEVFMRLADEIDVETDLDTMSSQQELEPTRSAGLSRSHNKEKALVAVQTKDQDLRLQSGNGTGFIKQTTVLFQKRFTIMIRNSFPSISALCIPIIAAGVLTILLGNYQNAGCSRTQQVDTSSTQNLSKNIDLDLVFGPANMLNAQDLQRVSDSLSSVVDTGGSALGSILKSIHTVDTLDEFNSYIKTNFANVTPGGVFLGGNGSTSTFAYRADGGVYSYANGGIVTSVFVQNALNILLSNTSISTQFSGFDVPWASGTGKTLQVVFYFSLAMAAYPAFFALYPTVERLRKVREVEYSNGVRSLPLWLAYLSFDATIALIASAGAIICFAAASSAAWYHIGYLFIIFFLYGIASILLAYVISLMAITQLAAFACCAGGQALMVVLYMTAYFQIIANAPADEINSDILISHFSIAIITPAGNLVRGLLIGLNVFSILCSGNPPVQASNPERVTLYGGPIIYLILQSLFLFWILWQSDQGFSLLRFKKTELQTDVEQSSTNEKEVQDEVQRVGSSSDGLRLLHLFKSFKERFRKRSSLAVDDLSFGVEAGEVFALVGPNGAGKSTTISMIRGDYAPDRHHGDIFVDGYSVLKQKPLARAQLGVCPQFDAMDQMTVTEHLRFYSRIRGVQDVNHNVQEIVKAVGLTAFKDRVASKLSGGNKRKLSLGIALTGNPKVLLLDEPSSGMDPVAKRQMWRILSTVAPGRSILLTTHSMEEADHLSSRIGVLSKRLLDIGTPHHLRQKHADGYHIHLITHSGPHTTEEEYKAIENWMRDNIPAARLDGAWRVWGGQMRWDVPISADGHACPLTNTSTTGTIEKPNATSATTRELDRIDCVRPSTQPGVAFTTGSLFALLESSKAELGLEHFAVSPNTFDEVFINIARKHDVEEENFLTKPGWKWMGWKKGFQREVVDAASGGEETSATNAAHDSPPSGFRWKWKWLLWPWFQ